MNIQNTSKKSYKPLLILSLFVIFVISTTTAYFTNSSQSDENVFTSGDLKIEVTQDNVLSVQNWFPGSEHSMEFSMTNTGSMTEYAKGYLGGIWSSEELDTSVFEITKLERKVNDEWLVINSTGLNIGDEFYLSADGSELNLLELIPGAREDFKLTTKLSETTEDQYQNEFFSASLHLAARQIDDGAEWPVNY
ncbi:M73 family metallopeptidase [Patescibacteria group bacterium]|nr:M73 family metallopeptidase [Patescibacteria group bacterium]